MNVSIARLELSFLSISLVYTYFIRNTTSTQAIVVPSIAFLDNLEQWYLVLFLEKLLPETRKFLPAVKADGFFQIS
ncbi:hypothetical protein [Chroococcidiopsis sp. TS-821]|uniref:hypothetical protein n=1 Tax=Chroococcidiopsis sp. TS-821 TaxID=1378066 RepID=UPI000D4F6829|nr:hypothetical protein [Chroococcidiopsis sp. TS-821]PPS41948.1 hypothetical protein B1A85_15830 [Chroococcidiopsis sp. TS-821]